MPAPVPCRARPCRCGERLATQVGAELRAAYGGGRDCMLTLICLSNAGSIVYYISPLATALKVTWGG